MKARYSHILLVASALTAFVGCREATVQPPPEPLSLTAWKTMPPDQKYAAENLERLRESEPSFQNDDAWAQFVRTTVLPAKRRMK